MKPGKKHRKQLCIPKEGRRREGRRPIETREWMKQLLRGRFFPLYYD
jgi:hypothetical protein